MICHGEVARKQASLGLTRWGDGCIILSVSASAYEALFLVMR